MYKIPLLERAKEVRQMERCKVCIHLNPKGSADHCYLFREIIVPCVLYRNKKSEG